MTDFGFEFDPDAIPESDRDFDTLPDQDTVAQPIESKMIVSDDQTKQTLELTWELLEGPQQGRRFWQKLKLVHPTPMSVEIDGRLLKKHAAAVGHVGALRNTDPILFKPVRIRIGTEKGTNGYKDKNVIKGYSPASAPASATPAAAAPAAAAKPWGAKAA